MRPFEGIKILDTTHVLAGPFATYQLAVLGADVIKIEDPGDPDQSRGIGFDPALNEQGLGTGFLTQGSNKRAMTLNLKTEQGRDILKRLVRDADIFVENYRPGAFEALGLGYSDLSAINPRLIYCSISAFGQNGPRREQTAYDFIIQGTSGLMAMTGTPEVHPVKVGASVIDYATGTMGAFALASALFQRERTGRGQRIDLSMFDSALMMMSSSITGHLRTGREPKPSGNAQLFSTNSCYEAKEGLIVLGASNLGQQKRLWAALGHPEMAKTTHSARDADRKRETELLREIMKERTAGEWEDFLQARHVPAARVRGIAEALRDPQLEERNVVSRHGRGGDFELGLAVPVAAFRYEHGGPAVDSPPRGLGADTAAILVELGMSPAEIDELRKVSVI